MNFFTFAGIVSVLKLITLLMKFILAIDFYTSFHSGLLSNELIAHTTASIVIFTNAGGDPNALI